MSFSLFDDLREPSRPHIWGLLVAIVLLAGVSGGCGLPDYEVIETPTLLATGSSTVLGFTTPADDSNIRGYILYYKVYDTTASDYTDNINADVNAFDPSSYADDELPVGSTVPNSRGFAQMGLVGDKVLSNPTLNHPGASTAVYVDFNPDDPAGADSDNSLRYQPIAGTGTVDSITTIYATLARGFLDPTDNASYSAPDPGAGEDLYLREIIPGETFRLFVDDWDFDYSSGDDFNDGDLRDGSNKLSNQPGSSLSDIVDCGTPFFNSTHDAGELHIAMCVVSYGVTDDLNILYSQPVYLGYVSYLPTNDTTLRSTIR